MFLEEVLESYPKQLLVPNGETIVIRPLNSSDFEKLFKYFSTQLDEKDTAFLKDNVRDPETIKEWCNNTNYERVLPLIALIDDNVVSASSLHMSNFGWSRYIGKVRLTVAKPHRRKGIGSTMLREIEDIARRLGIERLWAEIVSEAQEEALSLFLKHGFSKRAVLKRMAEDPQGNYHDVIICIKELVPY